MPHRREGNKILSKSGGSWHLKQTCRSAENAKSAIRLLEGLEHGTIKPRQVGKLKRKKS